MTGDSGPDAATDPLAATLDRLTNHLLASRTPDGHWAGLLSSSPLSTATAAIALTLVARGPGTAGGAPGLDRLAAGGVAWLIRTQNADGGWGDTPDSPSNVSTTALVWSALTLTGAGDETPGGVAALTRVREWMREAAGGLDPQPLVRTITARYGTDRTFSVPILTVLALAGLLGAGDDGWRRVPPLPFELAAVPASWYRFLRLPVVSYALPALIAMGHARHRRRPTRNPLAWLARTATARPTLARLDRLQPTSGGFLEATPLTSFVVMSLVAAGETAHPVVGRGVTFLERSARADGSWPIDTNLATWVTTLGVNALARRPDWRVRLDQAARARLARWLLEQQYRERHVYTGADPGGWAWTDLPGGVPDADDTPGALLALHALVPDDPASAEAAAAGIGWLLDLQNADGGMPTFCRGWGALPFDRSSPDLTAHALRAWSTWRPVLPDALGARADRARARAVAYLRRAQQADGSWIPLWFGNQRAPDDASPVYGTARVLEGLACLADADTAPDAETRAAAWLAAARNAAGGWGGAPGVAPSIEETAVAVSALAVHARQRGSGAADVAAAIEDGVRWLVAATDHGRRAPAAPVGLYFAKLWYAETLYPWIFATAALADAAAWRKARGR